MCLPKSPGMSEYEKADRNNKCVSEIVHVAAFFEVEGKGSNQEQCEGVTGRSNQ